MINRPQLLDGEHIPAEFGVRFYSDNSVSVVADGHWFGRLLLAPQILDDTLDSFNFSQTTGLLLGNPGHHEWSFVSLSSNYHILDLNRDRMLLNKVP